MNAMKLPSGKRLKSALLGLCQRMFQAQRASPTVRVPKAGLLAGEAESDDAPRACGWFDSSHDLQHGLRVQEHLSADGLARELPLGAWLDLQLNAWRAAAPAAAPPAFAQAMTHAS